MSGFQTGLPVLREPSDDVYRILLVEDDSGDALLVKEILVDTGLSYSLLWTRTPAEALAALADQPADCILLDLRLPDASGIPFLNAVQAACPAAAVIVLTGLAEPRNGDSAFAHGAQDYLVKDQMDPELMNRSVRYAIHRKHVERTNAKLLEHRVRAEENARLERGLLPAPLLDHPAVTAVIRYLPSRESALLGGDFLDLVQTPDGRVHAVIGDVSGHGPDEAALGVCLRITWRALILAGHHDTDLLDLLEQVLVVERPRPEMFATCAILTLDPSDGSVTLYLAGHHEPLVTIGGKTEMVYAKHGTALGIAPGQRKWHATTVTLPDAGALLLFTDGLTEGHDSPESSRRLGMSGLIDLITAAPDLEAGALLDHLVGTVHALDAGRHADDLAILHLGRVSRTL